MERNVNCLNSRTIISHVKRHCPQFLSSLLDGLDPYLDAVDDVEGYLCDEHNWFSQEVCAQMFERVRTFTGDQDVARIIGRESITLRRFGYVENIFIKAFGHPYLTVLRAPAINAKFNKTKTVEIVKSDWSHAIIRLKWFPELGSSKDICKYNLGVYESIPTVWGLPLGTITEEMCQFDGDEYCEFRLEWAKKSLFALLFGMFTRRKEILRESMDELEREKQLLEEKYREVEALNIAMKKKVDQLTSLDACSKATTSILETDRLLDVVMSLVTNIMEFDRALIMLVDEQGKRLVTAKVAGGDERSKEKLLDYSISLDRTNNILARVVASGIAQTVGDVDHSILRKDNIILKNFKPESFVAIPLITRNKVIGVMAAERVQGLENFTSNDLDYVMNFCNQIAISLDNARLIEHMKGSFVSSILSLAQALEAKDSYTRGHSNRVATYATIAARHMGMHEDQVDTIRLMALMHDVGKIGIPDSIINKPSELTYQEFMAIKRHPLVSVRIIEPLLTNRRELRHIKSHHERFDGFGYPEGLAGEEIPIEARVIAVADSFDAMTTSRPYRKSLDRIAALEEIIRNRGTQFCPAVADIFVDIVSSFPEGLYRHINDAPVEELHFE
jgi:HD-GYP domain-containing protein (c-di-GMP phosphodiesterase class II)